MFDVNSNAFETRWNRTSGMGPSGGGGTVARCGFGRRPFSCFVFALRNWMPFLFAGVRLLCGGQCRGVDAAGARRFSRCGNRLALSGSTHVGGMGRRRAPEPSTVPSMGAGHKGGPSW